MDDLKKQWESTAPTECDLCHDDLEDSFIDGKTKYGPWGIMCSTCHEIYGCGLGLGLGQKYDLKTLDKLEG